MSSELIIVGSQQPIPLWVPEADIFLDQESIGKISVRDHISFSILPGKYLLYLSSRTLGIRQRTNKVQFKIDDGESITVLYSISFWTGAGVLKTLSLQNLTEKMEVYMSDTFNNDFRNATIANLANKVVDNARQQANQNIYAVEQKQTLIDAAAEIQKLLRQLEGSNPAATEVEKIMYVNDETTPSFKRRVAGALQSGGETAIEEFLDNPYINVGKAIIKGWIKPE
ncbi:hypothetical protein ACSQ6I_21010 [Anabaena sp. WFMT]|uniref:hypothetical protein n=1 Tax=Anabaena sp. WFMT TaxID=3449730 RepID=UPI003F23A972